MATGSELPEDLQSIELLSQALLGDEDEFDKILSQFPSLESLDPYFPQGACNSVQSTPSNNRFRDPVSEEEVKAAQKAVIPHNTRKIPIGQLVCGRSGVSRDGVDFRVYHLSFQLIFTY